MISPEGTSDFRRWQSGTIIIDAPRLSLDSPCPGHALRQPSLVAPPNVWNSLPNDIRNDISLSTFRAKLKTHFLLLRTRDEHSQKTENVPAPLYYWLSWHYRRDTNLFFTLHYITFYLWHVTTKIIGRCNWVVHWRKCWCICTLSSCCWTAGSTTRWRSDSELGHIILV